jgi:hypothetical protein
MDGISCKGLWSLPRRDSEERKDLNQQMRSRVKCGEKSGWVGGKILCCHRSQWTLTREMRIFILFLFVSLSQEGDIIKMMLLKWLIWCCTAGSVKEEDRSNQLEKIVAVKTEYASPKTLLCLWSPPVHFLTTYYVVRTTLGAFYRVLFWNANNL